MEEKKELEEIISQVREISTFVIDGYTNAATQPFEEIAKQLEGNEKLIVAANCKASRNCAQFTKELFDFIGKKLDEYYEKSEASRKERIEKKEKEDNERSIKNIDLMSETEDLSDVRDAYNKYANITMLIDGKLVKKLTELSSDISGLKLRLLKNALNLDYHAEIEEVVKLNNNHFVFHYIVKEDIRDKEGLYTGKTKETKKTSDAKIKSIEVL